jgi:putative transposase
MELKKIHHPPHIYLDDSIYFITARIYQKERILDTDSKKKVLFENLWNEFGKIGYKLYSWAILDNHYHIEFKTKIGKTLGEALNFIHGRTSFEINKLDNTRGRKIFQNYLDHCIRDEKDFYHHFNYIHHNPVKHKYVKNQKEVFDYKFCSYKQWVIKKEEDWIGSCFETYPIIDFTVDGDDY